MSAEEETVTALEAAGVVALVSTRVYPDAIPQEHVLPAIVYQRTQTNFVPTIHNSVSLTRAQIALGCYAETRASAEAVADAAHTAMLDAGFIPLNRAGDYDSDTGGFIVASLFEHIAAS